MPFLFYLVPQAMDIFSKTAIIGTLDVVLNLPLKAYLCRGKGIFFAISMED